MSGGRTESRKLKGGQLLAVVQPPGEKWRIKYFEHSQMVRTASGEPVKGSVMASVLLGEEPVLEWQTSMPESWKGMEFDSADEAAAFVERELAAVAK